VTPEILALYADDLSTFELDDVEEALEVFGKAVPEQYEAPFPCIGVFLKTVESVVNRRKREERKRKEELEDQEKTRLHEEAYRLDPERYAREEREFQEKVMALNTKLGIPNNLKPKQH
jgi:hypothetical protein